MPSPVRALGPTLVLVWSNERAGLSGRGVPHLLLRKFVLKVPYVTRKKIPKARFVFFFAQPISDTTSAIPDAAMSPPPHCISQQAPVSRWWHVGPRFSLQTTKSAVSRRRRVGRWKHSRSPHCPRLPPRHSHRGQISFALTPARDDDSAFMRSSLPGHSNRL